MTVATIARKTTDRFDAQAIKQGEFNVAARLAKMKLNPFPSEAVPREIQFLSTGKVIGITNVGTAILQQDWSGHCLSCRGLKDVDAEIRLCENCIEDRRERHLTLERQRLGQQAQIEDLPEQIQERVQEAIASLEKGIADLESGLRTLFQETTQSQPTKFGPDVSVRRDVFDAVEKWLAVKRRPMLISPSMAPPDLADKYRKLVADTERLRSRLLADPAKMSSVLYEAFLSMKLIKPVY